MSKPNSTADINRIASEMEREDISVIVEELKTLDPASPAVVTDTTSEAGPVALTRYDEAITAGAAIELLAA